MNRSDSETFSIREEAPRRGKPIGKSGKATDKDSNPPTRDEQGRRPRIENEPKKEPLK